MICFRNLYLWYSDTTKLKIYDNENSCDLLSKFISLIFWYNSEAQIWLRSFVVICFRNLYLWYSDTTQRSKHWNVKGCDLLSKFISLIFWYNREVESDLRWIVVICFRNLYLWYSDTTVDHYLLQQPPLWFAFEIYIFDILIQLFAYLGEVGAGCDLLSKFISLIFWYNRCRRRQRWLELWFAFEIYIFDILIQLQAFCAGFRWVVICFRNLYLWYSDTT